MNHKNQCITRRDMLKRSGVAAAAIVVAPMINRGRFRLFGGNFERVLSQIWI